MKHSPIVILELLKVPDFRSICWNSLWQGLDRKALPNLRRIVLHRSNQWHDVDAVEDKGPIMHCHLRALAKQDSGATGVDESEAGVWLVPPLPSVNLVPCHEGAAAWVEMLWQNKFREDDKIR